MVLNKLHNECNNTFHNKTSSTFIASQYDQLSVRKVCISQSIQYEPQNCSPKGTQCKIATESRGVQCSIEGITDHYKSCDLQYNFLQRESKSTQWSLEDIPDDRNSLWSCKVHTCTSGAANNSKDATNTNSSSHKQHSFPRENVTSPASCMQPLYAEELETSGRADTTKVQHLQRSRLCKKNLSASSLFSTILKQRKNTSASSCTSGVTEMYSSRSGLESLEENPVSIELPKQVVQRKKKQLWNPSYEIISVPENDDSLYFSTLYPKEEDRPRKHKCNQNRTSFAHSRSRYTYNEELAVVKYISKKNLYKQVRGVSIWQDMEAEIKIDRSWQSLKEHFRKKILPNIDKFELPSKVKKSFHKVVMR